MTMTPTTQNHTTEIEAQTLPPIQQPAPIAKPANYGPPPSTAMTVAPTEVNRFSLEPTTFAQAYNVAAMFAKIKFCGADTAEDAMTRIMYGREFGWGAVQSMKNVYVVNGQPGMYAATILALCLGDPRCEEFVCLHTDDQKATFRAKRRGQEKPIEMTYTAADAVRQQLVKKDGNYEKVPANMYRARCITNLANLLFPDITRGVGAVEVLREEMTGEVVNTGERASAVASEPKPVPQSQARDFVHEQRELLGRISGTLTKETAKKLRQDIDAWEAPAPIKQPVVEAYGARMKGAAKAETNGAAPVTQQPEMPAGRQPGEEG